MPNSNDNIPIELPKILVVDDRPENIYAIKTILKKVDVELFTVTSGMDALALTLRQEFALILLDVEMPDMGGYEVASLMHDHADTQFVPIIFVTANSQGDQYIREGYEVGAVDYLFKPIEPALLLSKVRTFVNLHVQKQILKHEILERKQAEKLKDEFVAVISHELRTPLTSIQGSLGLLLGKAVGNVDDKAMQLIEIAHNNSTRLIKLINELLDIQKIQSGKMEIEQISINLLELIKKTISDNHPYAEKHHVSFKLADNIEDYKQIHAIGDPDRLTQVLTNLLSNAAKFSHKGGEVIISITEEERKVFISVSDNGIGIPEEFRDRIFQKFAQADSSSARSKQGTGLGLNLSKAIMQEHRGDLTYESSSDLGTSFIMELWKETGN